MDKEYDYVNPNHYKSSGKETFEMMIERNCPKQYKCIYNPNGEEPDIDKVMESLRSIAK